MLEIKYEYRAAAKQLGAGYHWIPLGSGNPLPTVTPCKAHITKHKSRWSYLNTFASTNKVFEYKIQRRPVNEWEDFE